jgi:hypothetical protein
VAKDPNLARRHDDADCGTALLHDERVSPIEKDAKAVDVARVRRNQAVTEVKAEDVGVGVGRYARDEFGPSWATGARCRASAMGMRWPAQASTSPHPVADRAAIDAKLSGDLAVIPAGIGELKGPLNLPNGLHCSDAAGGTRTHKPLRAAAFEAASFANLDTAAGSTIVDLTLRALAVATARNQAFCGNFLQFRHRLVAVRPL